MTFHHHDFSHRQRGFTLVELAIVITIIGLLIGGVLKGQEMIQNARVNATIAQVQSYQTALEAFRDRYDMWPGDISVATFRVPGCSAANHCSNGDGNSRLDVPGILAAYPDNSAINTEGTQFWKHLALADMIAGVNPAAGPAPAWGQTHPASNFTGGFHAITALGSVGGQSGTYLRLQAPVSGTPYFGNGARDAISHKFAAQIDRKMDDGQPKAGYVYAQCENTHNTFVYVETDVRNNCVMWFRITG